MKAMIRISAWTAQSIWRYGNAIVYALYPDGTKEIADGDIDHEETDIKYGIEGELFGEPYEEKTHNVE